MAMNKNQTELALAAKKMNSCSRNAEGCLSEGVHRSAGKEVAESSGDGGMCILVIDMAEAWELQRPRFLAVGLFLSVLLVNSKQLIEHMKRVWKVRETWRPVQLSRRQRGNSLSTSRRKVIGSMQSSEVRGSTREMRS